MKSQSDATGATKQQKADALKLVKHLGQNGGLGSVPHAAEYQPVDFTEQQGNAIKGNIHNLDAASILSADNNIYLTQEQLAHANKIVPGWSQMMQQNSADAQPLLRGELPFSDLLQTVGNQAQTTGGLNIPGVAGPATLRDLGMSSIDAMKTGQGLMQGMTSMAQQMSPTSSLMSPQQMMLSPSDQIQAAMAQNQLIQQSTQNKYNLAAMPKPANLLTAQAALGFALQPNMQPNYAGIGGNLASQLGQIGMQHYGYGNGSSGTDPSTGLMNSGFYNSSAAASQAYGPGSVISQNPSGAGYYSAYSVPVS